jgi:hypothetical protein
MSRFARITEDPEYDDDATWQELEDLEEDQFFEQIEVPVDVSDVYYGA